MSYTDPRRYGELSLPGAIDVVRSVPMTRACASWGCAGPSARSSHDRAQRPGARQAQPVPACNRPTPEDGYHELQTLFQLLDHGDRLHFEPQHGGVISLHVLDTHRAARCPCRITWSCAPPANFPGPPAAKPEPRSALTNDCPPAATGGRQRRCGITLVALNELWRLELSTDELCRIGLGLGADVPLFIAPQRLGRRHRRTTRTGASAGTVVPCADPSLPGAHRDGFANENLTRTPQRSELPTFSRGDAETFASRLPAGCIRRWMKPSPGWGRFGNVRMSGTGEERLHLHCRRGCRQGNTDAAARRVGRVHGQGIDRLEHARQES